VGTLLLRGTFPRHTARETFHADDSTFVQSARDYFMIVPRFDMKGDLCPFRHDYPSGTRYTLAERRGREMSKVDFDANGTFVRFEKWGQRLSRRPLQQTDEPRGGQDSRHSVLREINDVFLRDDKFDFAHSANGRP
jgi:hypothetical protein